MVRRTHLWRLMLSALLIVVLALSLLPLGPDLPSTGWDKTNHLLAFAALAIVGCLAYPAQVPTLLLALLAYGGLIEVLQSFTGYRQAEWADVLADGLGLLLGSGLRQLARSVMPR